MVTRKFDDPLYRSIDLALIYADDGAPRTAARLLREAADEYDRRADRADAFITQLVARGEVEPESEVPQ